MKRFLAVYYGIGFASMLVRLDLVRGVQGAPGGAMKLSSQISD
jgi:hypothetical protein